MFWLLCTLLKLESTHEMQSGTCDGNAGTKTLYRKCKQFGHADSFLLLQLFADRLREAKGSITNLSAALAQNKVGKTLHSSGLKHHFCIDCILWHIE